jgi:tRNA (guanine37-N1)-methyltransferase
MSSNEQPSTSYSVTVVTLFPEFILQAVGHSILGRAISAGLITINVINPRDHSTNKHKTVDDYPFGGGAGMVMKTEPLVAAIEASRDTHGCDIPIIYMSPAGATLTQHIASELSQLNGMTLVCGHYEGIDERVREHWIDRELSIGDYVLTGGEPAAMVVIDAVCRLIPGVLGNDASPADESFSAGTLEYPHYTRPSDFRGHKVPDILLSGHHAKIEDWRRTQALVRTRSRRPDLWERLQPLSKEDRKRIDTYDRLSESN